MTPEAALLFAVWLGYGVVQGLRLPSAAPRLRRLPPRSRRARAMLWMLGGCASGVAALYAAASFTHGGGARPPWSTALIALGGGLFVHSQMVSAAYLLSLVLPARNDSGPKPSESKEPP